MAYIIGVRFRDAGKIYYFDPDGTEFEQGQFVIVETSKGIECGEVVLKNRDIEIDESMLPIHKIIRIASEKDLKTLAENKEKEKRAFDICCQKIKLHKLDMKLINVEYTFDCNKILFYFTADGRVDFRELVKDLAYMFRTRIELRQIGVRDEAKSIGGLGICGRPFCCHSFLGEFQPVSIKMAKEQGMLLNPTKISGTCGRLMCCLKYEQDVYNDLLKITPKIGAIVNTPDGKGNVIDVNLITGTLTVSLHKAMNAAAHTYKVKDVTLIKDAQIKVDKDEFEKLKKLENN